MKNIASILCTFLYVFAFSEEVPKFKLRGNVSLVVDYMTEYRDGLRFDNNYMPPDTTGIDFRAKNDPHHSIGDLGRVIGGTWGGIQAKMYANYSISTPVLNFNNPLMKDNTIKFTANYEISPITTNFGAQVTFTPVAFLIFNTGFLVGPAWKINDTLAGLGLNNKGTIQRLDFGGPVFQQWFSVTFQMDTAFVLPQQVQKWTHFVFLGTTTIKYQALIGIDYNQPYMYEECPGEQLGGWRLVADALLGYRYYIIEDNDFDKGRFIKRDNRNLIVTVGMYVWLDYLDISHYNDSPMANGWGSDFAFLNFGPAGQIDLPGNFYIRLFAMFRNDRVYTDDTVGNLYYQDRKYADYNIFFRFAGGFIGWNF